jgi:two-component sensor histidine kinase
VHHRIKNNLQGITGILRSFAQQHPEVTVPINQAISQVQSISISHGLQGRSISSSIRVCELTVEIAAGVESLWQKPIKVEIPDNWIPCTITEDEAVPLALVINELISNAAKHSGVDGQIKIMLSHEPRYDAITLTINNLGLIPSSFGLEATTGFGTGLQLVASLLPRENASLTWSQQDDTVVTTLGLDKPIIRLESPI